MDAANAGGTGWAVLPTDAATAWHLPLTAMIAVWRVGGLVLGLSTAAASVMVAGIAAIGTVVTAWLGHKTSRGITATTVLERDIDQRVRRLTDTTCASLKLNLDLVRARLIHEEMERPIRIAIRSYIEDMERLIEDLDDE